MDWDIRAADEAHCIDTLENSYTDTRAIPFWQPVADLPTFGSFFFSWPKNWTYLAFQRDLENLSR